MDTNDQNFKLKDSLYWKAMNHNAFPESKIRTVAILLGISFSLLPLYALSSGSFQPVDLIIFILSIYIIFTITHDELFGAVRLIAPFLPFLCWIIFVNSYYIILSGHLSSYLIATTQLVYAFAIVFFYYIAMTRVIEMRYGHIYLLLCLLLLSISPLIFSNFFGVSSADIEMRQTYSFNNPNQLGYFSLLLLCMFLTYISFYINGYFLKNKIIQLFLFIIFIIGNWFVFVSASRAGIAGVLLLDIVIILMLFRKNPLFCAGLVLMPFFIACFFFADGDFSVYTQGSLERLSHKDFFDKGDLLHRTLEQVNFDNDIYVILGSGPRHSFASGQIPLAEMFKTEAHNSVVGILSQYGIIGVLFLAVGFFLYAWRVGFSIPSLAVFASITIYNMSHYGLRFRLFWVVIALVAACSYLLSEKGGGEIFYRRMCGSSKDSVDVS